MLGNKKIRSKSKLLSCDGSQKEGWQALRSDLAKAFRELASAPLHISVFASRGDRQQVAHPHQVIRRRRPSEHPPHSLQTAEARLAHQGHRLEPTEDFLHPLPFPLTHGV